MSDFAKYCPKCYQFFSDLDLYTRHVEACGFTKKTAEKMADSRPPSAKMADSRRQTVAEKKMADHKSQTSAETKGASKPPTVDNGIENADNPLASAADCSLPSAVATEGGSPQVKSPKFKT